MPFSPPEKRAQGFDVVRYRRRCGERLGYFDVWAGSRTCRGVGWLGSNSFCAILLRDSYCWLLRFGLPTVPIVGKGWLGSSSFSAPCLVVATAWLLGEISPLAPELGRIVIRCLGGKSFPSLFEHDSDKKLPALAHPQPFTNPWLQIGVV